LFSLCRRPSKLDKKPDEENTGYESYKSKDKKKELV
jgi:hypothetical protein